MLKNEFIHLFKTLGCYYIYDVNTNTILNISKDLYDYFDNNVKTNKNFVNRELNKKISKLYDSGFLSNKCLKEIEHPYNEILPYYIKRRLNTITLQVTQQCNLRCSYCAYSGAYFNRKHSGKRMSFEIAKKGIDFLIENSSESPMLNIGFYGGEPLLEFDLISKCVSYAKQEAEGKELKFSMTTNGTMLDEKVISFLVENNFHVLISLDGPEEIHDKNRRFASNNQGTFKYIIDNVFYMKNKYPEYVDRNVSINAVLDGTTDFKCINKFFCNNEDIKSLKVNISLVADKYLKRSIDSYESYVIQQKYEKFKYLLYRINKLDRKYVTKLFDKGFAKLKDMFYHRKFTKGIPEKGHPSGPCIPGIRKLFMDVNGTFYPCERVSELSEPMNIGNIYEGLDLDKARDLLNIGKMTENECRNCWAYRFCHSCAIMADNLKELSAENKISYCKGIRSYIEENLKDYCLLNEFDCNFE